MRSNNLRDLYVTYPFMPVADPPEWFRAIKYMRLVFHIPSRSPLDMATNGDFVKATLTAITPLQATIRIDCAQYGLVNEEATVYVYISGVPKTLSYIYADNNLPTLSGLNYRIHPSCIIFRQAAPILRFEGPNGNSQPSVSLAYDSATGAISQTMNNTVQNTARDQINFVNGHNVEVSGSSDSILFTGTPGAGAGVWETAPYDTSDESFAGYRGKGLRSINGKSGNVLIQGDRSVQVTDENNSIKITPVRLDGAPA